MANAYVDPWDMLNNFCFHVHAQKSLFIGEIANGGFFTSSSSPSPVSSLSWFPAKNLVLIYLKLYEIICVNIYIQSWDEDCELNT